MCACEEQGQGGALLVGCGKSPPPTQPTVRDPPRHHTRPDKKKTQAAVCVVRVVVVCTSLLCPFRVHPFLLVDLDMIFGMMDDGHKAQDRQISLDELLASCSAGPNRGFGFSAVGCLLSLSSHQSIVFSSPLSHSLALTIARQSITGRAR